MQSLFDIIEISDLEDSIVQIMGAISSDFLLRIHSESWLIETAGQDYAHHCYPIEELEAYIRALMTPPTIDIGIEYPAFSFPEDAVDADAYHYILSPIECVTEAYEVYFEINEAASPKWLERPLDITMAARFMPLVKSHDNVLLVHGPHLDIFLDYIATREDFAYLLALPEGRNRALLQSTYSTLHRIYA